MIIKHSLCVTQKNWKLRYVFKIKSYSINMYVLTNVQSGLVFSLVNNPAISDANHSSPTSSSQVWPLLGHCQIQQQQPRLRPTLSFGYVFMYLLLVSHRVSNHYTPLPQYFQPSPPILSTLSHNTVNPLVSWT